MTCVVVISFLLLCNFYLDYNKIDLIGFAKMQAVLEDTLFRWEMNFENRNKEVTDEGLKWIDNEEG